MLESKVKRILTFFLIFGLRLAPASPLKAGPLGGDFLKTKPKLVVVLVIDQFRADYLTRFQAQFLPATGHGGQLGGYEYLMEKGAWFPNGQYSLLQNMTGPGHATILTGAYPYLTGIPINEWFDRSKQQPVYCVEDPAYQWFGGSPDPHVGTSPNNLVGTTVGDELKNIHPESRVVSLSLKDRAAILMGGHRPDAAIWMDPFRFQWTSTTYYFPEGKLPAWVDPVNSRLNGLRDQLVKGFAEKGLLARQPIAALGSFLPQGLRWGDKTAEATPVGLALTEELAEKAVEAYGLGRGKQTDLLAVSFSSHDYAGHAFGPNNPAMEEMTLAEDVELSKLFNFLKGRVPGGMKSVMVVLTADHGIAPNPELVAMAKIPAGRIDEPALIGELEKAMEARFGKTKENWVLQVKEMNVYLNPHALAEKSLDPTEAENEIKAELLKLPAIATAFTATEYRDHKTPIGIYRTQIDHQYFPGRSGDVVGILKPFFISSDETANHQTGYSYDRTVPILFAGPHIVPGVYATPCEATDIAPTLAFLNGTVAPSQSDGRVLAEILGR